MPDNDQNDKGSHPLDNEALRAKLEELKIRMASLHRRVAALEEKKRDESTQGRK